MPEVGYDQNPLSFFKKHERNSYFDNVIKAFIENRSSIFVIFWFIAFFSSPTIKVIPDRKFTRRVARQILTDEQYSPTQNLAFKYNKCRLFTVIMIPRNGMSKQPILCYKWIIFKKKKKRLVKEYIILF